MDDQSKQNVSLFLDALDEKSRKIFWYFRWHGHARLAELVDIIGAANDMEVLYRLREVINPTAIRIFGKPVLEFCESKVNPINGKKVIFNWWLLDFEEGKQPLTGEDKRILMDVFDEEDQIMIVAEVSPSVRVKDMAKVEEKHGILSIKLEKLP
ncbi:hypothetical protein [Marinisporobacter balticus]|uniref:Uncharacterized protein n=1 Tax=Marinisporobacter balticus TaxID=2018667 RepID=A0A4R2LDE0_9FIRM|nr:hypothetical protein [Marinisporobacter balticus]TCO77365.1 hypothetical protein EV214_1067 [Marinisporobacter balticus]